jgi:hypothetical protein
VTSKRRTSKETLDRELAKCDLVCANCHRERTYQRRQQAKQHMASEKSPKEG